jgi:hypothetical protein
VASFFETYKETLTANIPSATLFSQRTHYTCPANRIAYFFLTAVDFSGTDAGFNSLHIEAYFFNSARPVDQFGFQGTGSVSLSNLSLGMIMLRPGESVKSRMGNTDPNITFAVMTGTYRVFEMNLATS